jgi:hypothetical protein
VVWRSSEPRMKAVGKGWPSTVRRFQRVDSMTTSAEETCGLRVRM